MRLDLEDCEKTAPKYGCANLFAYSMSGLGLLLTELPSQVKITKSQTEIKTFCKLARFESICLGTP